MLPGYLWAASLSTSSRESGRADVPVGQGERQRVPNMNQDSNAQNLLEKSHPRPIEIAAKEQSSVRLRPTREIHHTSLPPRVSMMPHFSSQPTDAEIFEAHVFPLALVPMGKTTVAENHVLAQTLVKYLKRSDPEDQSIILKYLRENPGSPWKVSLLVNLGILWRENGYFLQALAAWKEAWQLSKNQTNYRTKALADRAFGEMAELYAWVGRYKTLKSLFAQVPHRVFIGGAQQMVSEARDGLWVLNNDPGAGFMCGPYALNQIITTTHAHANLKVLSATRSTQRGFSLAKLQQLANRIGLKYQMAKRSPGSPVIPDSVVHWKLNHYGALLQERNGKYLIQDSTFSRMYGRELWVSKASLDKASDGYFLVPDGPLPNGWCHVSEAEGQKVFGKGTTGGPNPNACTPNDCKSCKTGKGDHGVAQYDAFLMLVGLNITDTPLFYTPPRGPAIQFTVNYNQRDAFSEVDPQYSNLGAKWTFDWFSYILDTGAAGNRDSVWRYARGGGRVLENGYDSTTGYYSADRDGNILQYIATNDSYVLTLPDGSKQFYSQPGTANTDGRKMFMTAIEDPAGNMVRLFFDTNVLGRIDYVVDALEQTNTLNYDWPGDPYKITSVQDPFGRMASFEYDTSGRLVKITDVIGMSSAFTYGTFNPGNLSCISSMTTPYGTSTFSCGEDDGSASNPTRWLTMTDPDGGEEMVKYIDSGSYPSGEATTNIPTGYYDTGGGNNVYIAGGSSWLMYRNTFYWNKKQYPLSNNGNILTNATIYHWLHDTDDTFTNATLCSGILESIKPPLENRIWLLYPGQQQSPYSYGITLRKPCVIARVVDDPANPNGYTNQIYQIGYDAQGQVTNFIDPLGRQTALDYAANGVDLLDVRQTTGGTMNKILAQFGPYNTQHRPAYYTNAAQQVWTMGWNSYGQLTNVINPKNEDIQLHYNPDSYLTSILRPWFGGIKTNSLTYDGDGRVYTFTDSQGYTITNDYDNLNRLTASIYPDGTSNVYQYSRLDLTGMRDRAGRWTWMTYDDVGHQTSVLDPLGRLTEYTWCGCGSLESIKDPLSHVTSWSRDLEGRVTEKTYDDGSHVDYTYYPLSGLLKSVTDARGEVKKYTYNPDDTMAGVIYSGTTYYDASGNPIVTPPVGFAYAPNYNRVLTVTNGTGSTAFTYQYSYYPVGVLGAGRLETVASPLATNTYSYNSLGQLTSRSIDGVNESWTYDDLDRMTNDTNPLGSFTASYLDATRRITSLVYPNGQSTTYSYYGNSGDQRLKQIENWDPNLGPRQLSIFAYTYDVLGQIKQWSLTSAFENPVTSVRSYGYDSAGQLLNVAEGPADGMVSNVWSYGYDPAGNRTNLELEVTANSAATVSVSSYNDLNELLSQSGTSPLPVFFQGKINKPGTVGIGLAGDNGQEARMTQDTNSTSNGKIFTEGVNLPTGNNTVSITATNLNGYTSSSNYSLTVAGGQNISFAYDADGNLTNEATATSTNEYDWDAENRLVEMTQWTNGMRLTSQFSYDGFGRIVKIVEETNGVIGSTKQFVWSKKHLCEELNNNNNVTRRFFAYGEQIDGTNYYFTKDHLGSIREVTDSSGNIVGRYDYSPYGVRTLVQGSDVSDFGFTGYYVHKVSGLQFALYRAYDANLGRFINRDPIGEAGGLNLYDYVANDPMNWIDSLGFADGAAGTFEKGLGYAADEDVITGGPEDPVGDAVALAILAGFGVAAVCHMSAEHKKNARPSTKGKHEKGTREKGRKNWDKKRKHPGWKNVPKRK